MKKSEIKQLIKETLTELKGHSYSFKQLTDLVLNSDRNNPDKAKMQSAENTLKYLGFYDSEGSIKSKNFNKNFKTTDGKSLFDLEKWYEENLT